MAGVLDRVGVPGAEVLARVKTGAPFKEIRAAHEQAVGEWERLRGADLRGRRPGRLRAPDEPPRGDAALARRTIEGVIHLFDEQPDLNEFKYTTLFR